MTPLTLDALARATHTLAARDPALDAIVANHGVPPLWPIEPGFGGLINIILGQQVSLASAGAAWRRLIERIGPPAPARLLELDDDDMLAVGFSRQKAGYARGLAQMIIDDSLDLDAINAMSDDDARTALMQIRGIGAWSSDIYLLMALRRPDIWPSGDLALITAAREAFELADARRSRGGGNPVDTQVAALAETWRPWRSVAARILWMDYLKKRGRDL